MNPSDFWNRTAGHRPWVIAGGITALLVVAVFLYGLGAMAGSIYHYAKPPVPVADKVTIKAVDQDRNDEALVALFSKRCVKQWLTATTSTPESTLAQCFTVPPKGKAASDFPATVSDVDTYKPQLTYRDGEISYWSVLVSATVKEFASPSASWQFYWLSVALPTTGGPRAVVMPDVRATALPEGVDIELASVLAVPSTSELYTQVQGFVKAYLCGAPGQTAPPCAADMTSYVTSDSGLTSLGQVYYDVSIESMEADIPVDGAPAPGEQAHVLVTVTAKERTGGKKAMQYPLLVVDAAGGWRVSALEDLPAITGRMLTPGER
ncbi:Uncharacterised protein [Mycobacteroides abscessus subsp. massiliense]|uniref:hypothetical protein n=1 Tax=Mycobacteroides abscessus TaxID=36809 RepID=UPI0009A85F02|nr:hypothetical protein [Mycobacteroides abscessus]SLE83247.1 Uncharacterised protein [Mycobacteroides abscessus subsp. massiliense]